MPAHCLLVVLDPDRGGLGGTQGVDPEQVRQRAMVDADPLGDLKEPDQLEPVQTLSAGLVLVDFRQPGVDGGVGGDQAIDVGVTEEPAHAMHHRVDRRRPPPQAAEVVDVQLDVTTLDPDQRVEVVDLTPVEPPPQLVGVEKVSGPGVPGQIGHSPSHARRRHGEACEPRDGMPPGSPGRSNAMTWG